LISKESNGTGSKEREPQQRRKKDATRKKRLKK